MDTQPTPQNPGLAGEQQSEVRPETASGLQPETHGNPGAAELTPQPSTASGQASQMTAASQPPALQATPVASVADASHAGNPPAVTGPMLAADVDVIEPEWVDKAEQVIKSSQGDPYSEEEAVEDLQRDYLKKRYGHDVKDAGSDSSKPGVS